MGPTLESPHRERAKKDFMTALDLLKEQLTQESELLQKINFPDFTSPNSVETKASLFEDALERMVEVQKEQKKSKKILKEVWLQWFKKLRPFVTRFLSIAQSASSVFPQCVHVHSLTRIFRLAF
jgi:hypothetical protein